ncbi:MAG: hypothetical protein DRN81_06135 [Thermoproteota archaeon]|nr:MAG: hypothetical protein DRN81_06135 [Candidatus Korarchaeota archaeon]
MTLTDAGREYIAKNIGVGNCWVYSGLSWVAESVTGDRVNRTGGTGKAVKDIIDPTTDHIEINGLNISKATLRDNNGGNDVTISDVTNEILKNDGYPAGENQYCAPPPGPGPGPTGKTYLCVLTSEDLADVYVDIDTNPDPNPDLSPSRSSPPWPCTEVSAAPSPKGTTHKITVRKAGFKEAEEYVTCFENEKKYVRIYLEPLAGAHVGTLELHAYKEGTTEEIHANFDIEGISGEERYITPYTMNVPEKTYAWIRFYCTGFEDYEVTNVVVNEGETTTVTAYMKPKRLWKQVYVGPPIVLLVIDDFDMPSRLYWDSEYDFSVTIRCFEPGWYYANIELREPGDFMRTYDPADLGPTRWTIPLPEKEITEFDLNKKVKLKKSHVVPGPDTLPAGTYVAVAVAYAGRR